MGIQQAVQRCLPLALPQSIGEVDAEIREELEFHLSMRTEDNLRAGMPPAEARRAAQARFGDFEANRLACRKITLGPRIMFQKLQTALLVVLIGAVIYQGVMLFRIRSASSERINQLVQMVESLQTAGEPAQNNAAKMPFVAWHVEPPPAGNPTREAPTNDALEGWNAGGNPLQQPWSEWASLENNSH